MFAKLNKADFSGLDVLDGAGLEAERYKSDTMYQGSPDFVVRVRDHKDMQAILQQCYAKEIPATICAAQTSMTGSSVADNGVLISTEKLEGIIDISSYEGSPVVLCHPGTVTADLQKAVAEAGFFFPVSTTSRAMSCIGGNVATNASGEDSYKYGSMRHYVRQLKVLLADGTEQVFTRTQPCNLPKRKNLAGLELASTDPIDYFIGSEGTLGLITEVMLDLLPQEAKYFSLLVPFPSHEAALACVVKVASTRTPNARALELIDKLALQYCCTHAQAPKFSLNVQALLYIKQEYHNEDEYEQLLNVWWKVLAEFSSDELLSQTLVASAPSEQALFRELRHHIPSTLNEQAREFWKDGGGKVGSDWWAPVQSLPELLQFFFEEAENANLPAMAYAHIGDGHPHTNLITKNAEQKKKARAIVCECAKRAVALGGGAAGEHGIGKINRDLVALQYDAEQLAKMREIKQRFDPKNLLGRGNIFS